MQISLGLQCNDDLLVSVAYPGPFIEKFKQHPRIITVMKQKPDKPNFSFSGMAKQIIESLIKTLDSSKTIQKENIPNKIIKENMDIMSNIFHDNINIFQNPSFLNLSFLF